MRSSHKSRFELAYTVKHTRWRPQLDWKPSNQGHVLTTEEKEHLTEASSALKDCLPDHRSLHQGVRQQDGTVDRGHVFDPTACEAYVIGGIATTLY